MPKKTTSKLTFKIKFNTKIIFTQHVLSGKILYMRSISEFTVLMDSAVPTLYDGTLVTAYEAIDWAFDYMDFQPDALYLNPRVYRDFINTASGRTIPNTIEFDWPIVTDKDAYIVKIGPASNIPDNTGYVVKNGTVVGKIIFQP